MTHLSAFHWLVLALLSLHAFLPNFGARLRPRAGQVDAVAELLRDFGQKSETPIEYEGAS